MTTLFNNEIIATLAVLFIPLYALNLGKIKLPCFIENLFKNTIFKIVFLSLLLIFNFEKTPHVALTVAIIFVLTLDYLDNKEIKENFAYLEAFNNANKINK